MRRLGTTGWLLLFAGVLVTWGTDPFASAEEASEPIAGEAAPIQSAEPIDPLFEAPAPTSPPDVPIRRVPQPIAKESATPAVPVDSSSSANPTESIFDGGWKAVDLPTRSPQDSIPTYRSEAARGLAPLTPPPATTPKPKQPDSSRAQALIHQRAAEEARQRKQRLDSRKHSRVSLSHPFPGQGMYAPGE